MPDAAAVAAVVVVGQGHFAAVAGSLHIGYHSLAADRSWDSLLVVVAHIVDNLAGSHIVAAVDHSPGCNLHIVGIGRSPDCIRRIVVRGQMTERRV